ncbi:MAG: hypothetical protein J5I47_11910 [Vicingus serpentipes]|nr:hypothetical protein [Vicingus serpentipes]
MKTSAELFRLIKSLSKSEKRYFKLISSLQSGEKNYIKLFDVIDKQEEYDEEEIKTIFKKETFIKHLPSEKNHLYGLILKGLRGFHADKSAASIIQEQLRNIELLYDKALYVECAKIVRKAKKIAYDYEKFYFLLDLIDWEKSLTEEEILRGDFKKDLNLLIKEEEECTEKLRNIAEYQKLYSKLNYAFRKGADYRNKEERKIVDEIAKHPLIIGKRTAMSTKAATACYSIKALCAKRDGNTKLPLENFSKVVTIMENNPFIMQELPKRYIKALNGMMIEYTAMGDWDNCSKYIKKMKDLRDRKGFSNMDVQLKLFIFSSNGELVRNLYLGNYKSSINKLIPEILERVEEFGGKVNKEANLLFNYNISATYFGVGDMKMALKYINYVLNSAETGLREDIFSFARLINLIIHYELGNYDLLNYTIKSTKRYITKNQRNYNFENTFLAGIKKLNKVNDPDELRKTFIKFKKDIVGPYKEIGRDYFGFITWIDSKIQQRPYVELVKEQSRQLV